MKYGLISLLPVQVARLFRLVHNVEPVLLDEQPRKSWVLLIRGRGFTRILRDEHVLSPYLLRPVDPSLPRPMRFPSRQGAAGHARSVGLMPVQTTWRVRES